MMASNQELYFVETVREFYYTIFLYFVNIFLVYTNKICIIMIDFLFVDRNF